MASYAKYRVWCEDEAAHVYSGWLSAAPTTCPNNGAHTITLSKTAVVEGNNSEFVALNKYDGTTAPTASDDADDGWDVGSEWADQTANKVYVCVDATVGAALWRETTPVTHTHDAADLDAGTLADARVAGSNVTQHEGAVDHDALTNFAIAEHREIDDGGMSTTDLWSASKIDGEISTLASGFDLKAGVDTSTKGVGDITLSGEQTLNGLLTSGSRVLVTDQTAPEENGIYDTVAGAWSRTPDADGTPAGEVSNGNITHVINSGSAKYRHKYLLVTADPITVGTTAQVWEEHQDIAFGTTGGTATEGDDPRVPAQDENDALAGTDGTPSTANPYVTNSDSRNTDARTPTTHAPSHVGADAIQNATAAQAGLATAAQITRLDAMDDGAEVNPDLISQAEAEAGAATTERIFSALRVAQAITALGSGGGVFGSEYQKEASDGISSTPETTYQQKVRLTTLSLPAGDYMVMWSCEHSTDKASVEVYLKLELDDTTVLAESGPRFSAAGFYEARGGIAPVTLTAAVHTIDLDHKTGTGTGIGSNIQRARITIWRVA